LSEGEPYAETQQQKSEVVQVHTGDSFRKVFPRNSDQMRAVSQGIEIHAKEQLPQRHEDLFTEEPQRLENLPHFCSTSQGTQLDH
jgi:hypothetical protein